MTSKTPLSSTIRSLCIIAATSLLLWGCSGSPNIGSLTTYHANGNLQAVIEIPAGTNHQLSYDAAANSFVDNGPINFLPYPGNVGFIPGTGQEEGASGPMRVMILSESQPTGTVMEVIPVGMIQLLDGVNMRKEVIAVPADPAQRSIQAASYRELSAELIYTLELWYQNHRGTNALEIAGWKNESSTTKEIEASQQP